MKKLILTIAASCLSAMAFAGKLTVTSADGQTSNDYDTFTAARNACVGGETITFNDDVSETIGAYFQITVSDLTIDMNGYTFALTGGFFQIYGSCDNLVFKNGTITSGDTLFLIREGSEGVGTVYLNNCVLRVGCLSYSTQGTLDLTDVTMIGGIFLSQGCASSHKTCVHSGYYAVAKAHDGAMTASLTIYGGHFGATFDPTNWVPAGGEYVVTPEHTVSGDAECSYTVSEVDAAPDILEVISADGVTTNVYKSLNGALADFGEGETLRLLTGLDITSAISISEPDMTIDLNGYSLVRATEGDFLVIGGGATGFTLRNGRTSSVNALTYTKGSVGLGDIYFIDLEIGGQCAVYGDYGTFNFSNTVVTTDYFVSQGCAAYLNVNFADGVIAPGKSPTDSAQDPMFTPAKVAVTSGRFTFDPRAWLAPNCYAVAETETVGGIACSYAVYEAEEALDVVEVISAAGATTGYKSVGEALDAVEDGETVRLLSNWTLDEVAGGATLNFAKNLTIDLNTFTMEFSGYLTFNADVDVMFKNGNIRQQGAGSAILVFNNENSTVSFENCGIRGYCLVYGERQNSVSLVNTDTILSYTVSGGGNARVDIVGGKHSMAKYHDGDGDMTKGTKITLSGGRYVENPVGDSRITIVDGQAVAVESLQEGTITYKYRLDDPQRFASYEAHVDNVYYQTLSAAIEGAADGTTIIMNADRDSSVVIAQNVYQKKSLTIDMNGHEIAGVGSIFYSLPGYSYVISNGTFRAKNGFSEVFALFNGVDLTLESSISVVRDEGVENGSLINLPDGNLSIRINGSSIDIPYLFNANWNGVSAAFEGEIVCNSKRMLFPNSPTGETIAISGGWWSVDPTDYVTDPTLKIKDYGEDYAAKGKICRYYVAKPLAGLTVIVK